MGWIGVAILGLTIGIVANAVGAHGRRQTTINLIAGLFGALWWPAVFWMVRANSCWNDVVASRERGDDTYCDRNRCCPGASAAVIVIRHKRIC